MSLIMGYKNNHPPHPQPSPRGGEGKGRGGFSPPIIARRLNGEAMSPPPSPSPLEGEGRGEGDRWARKGIMKVLLISLLGVFLCLLHGEATAKKKQKPFDLFTRDVHEMHNSIFESAKISCETCHANPDSYTDFKKINKQGCHTCHKNENAPVPANNDCKLCHAGGFPKPDNHKSGWISKHQTYAKNNDTYCTQCHPNKMFCIDCHQRRDTIQQRVHRRNFKFYHSIEARANPRKCDVCHTASYCQTCHAGKDNSSK